MAAAPANNSSINAGIEGTTTVTVDSQWTENWKLIDSTIVIATDTCNIYVVGAGTATLDPGDKLYIGVISNGGDFDAAPTDTFLLELPSCETASKSLSFYITYVDSLRSQTDANDTLYFTAAVKGDSHSEEVAITAFNISVVIADYDAAE